MFPRLRSNEMKSMARSGYDVEPNANAVYQGFPLLSSRRLRRSQQQTGISSLEYQGLDPEFITDWEQQLLMVLRIMGLYSLQHFLIPATAQWKKRRGLGEGISFTVEEASLPVWRALSHMTHRHPHGRVDQRQISYFTDHTGTRWDSNTRVAFKVPPSSQDLGDVIQELQILCHPPLQNHPSIVQLLGIAWVRQPKVDDQDGTEQQRLQQEQPTIVTEYASHGSLYDFLRSSTYNVQQVSLKTKLRLCMNLLEGLLV